METQKKAKFVETIPFHVEHLDLLDAREEERTGILALTDTKQRFERLGAGSIESKTFLYDGRILFIAGYVELWPGVVDCWMLPSIYVKTARMKFCKILKAYVDDIIGDMECHRFQTTAPDDAAHERWMKFLGLEKEGTLRKFTPNQKTYCMYAKVI